MPMPMPIRPPGSAARSDETESTSHLEETFPPASQTAAELRGVLGEIMPAYRARWGDSDEWDALVDFQRRLGAAGWGAPSWPTKIGGRSLTVREQLDCDPEYTRAQAPSRVAVYGTSNVGPTIAAVGTPPQLKHLGAIVRGDEFWCQGFSEPNAGSDLAGLQCRAEVTDTGFVINGQKVWTSIGMHATHCMLLARTDPDAMKHRGISALLLPLDTPGVSRRPIRQLTGESEFAELFFDDVFVPTSALLGPLHEGWRVTMTTLGFERTGVIKVAGSLVDDVNSLMHSQALAQADACSKQRAAQVYVNSRLLEWMGQRCLAESDMNAALMSSLIKLAWSQLGVRFAELSFDLAGPDALIGLTPAITRRFLGSRSYTIAGGTTEVMKNLIGERNLGLPREPKL